MAKLTAKQQRFVDEYLIDLNATQAAIRAGYSEKTAGQIGEQNLKKLEIQNTLTERMATRSERTTLNADQVLREIAAVALLPLDGAEVLGGLVKVSDKLKALEMAGKHLGLFTDKLKISGEVSNPFAGLTTEELRRLAGASSNDD